MTASGYGAFGHMQHPRASGPRSGPSSWPPNRDLNWVRLRLSGLYVSGDSNPHDNVETGSDAILENPQFAVVDTSYFIRQSIPFVGGGLVGVSWCNGVLADLRSSKDEGQSNFNNPDHPCRRRR